METFDHQEQRGSSGQVIDLETRKDKRGNNQQRPKVERRDIDIDCGEFSIRQSEFYYPIRKYSFGISRQGRDGNRTNFFHLESIDKLCEKLQELKKTCLAMIEADTQREEHRRLTNRTAAEKRADDHDRKVFKNAVNGAVKNPDFEAARRRSAKAKSKNRQAWEDPKSLVPPQESSSG
jgi:hypothetical protein